MNCQNWGKKMTISSSPSYPPFTALLDSQDNSTGSATHTLQKLCTPPTKADLLVLGAF